MVITFSVEIFYKYSNIKLALSQKLSFTLIKIQKPNKNKNLQTLMKTKKAIYFKNQILTFSEWMIT